MVSGAWAIHLRLQLCRYAITGDGSGRRPSSPASGRASASKTSGPAIIRTSFPLTSHSLSHTGSHSRPAPLATSDAHRCMFSVSLNCTWSNDLTYHCKGLSAFAKQSHCPGPRVRAHYNCDDGHLREADLRFSQDDSRVIDWFRWGSLQLHHVSWYQVHSFQSWTHLS